MTTQKQAVKKVLDSFQYQWHKYDWLGNWLEDINWHGEARLIREKNQEKGKEITERTLKLRRQEHLYNWESKKVKDVWMFNLVFGWGLDNSWEHTTGDGFVKELIALI